MSTNQPAQTFRSGSAEGAVWVNETDSGTKYFSLTVSRSYAVDDEGTTRWKRTQSLGSRHLLDLRRVIVSAEAWLVDQPASPGGYQPPPTLGGRHEVHPAPKVASLNPNSRSALNTTTNVEPS